MTLPEQDRPQEPQDPVVEDNAIHVPNPETARANGTQIGIAAVAVIAILFIFFYGVNNQRDETASSPSTTPVATTQPPAGGEKPSPQAQANPPANAPAPNQQQAKRPQSSPPASGTSNVPTTTGQGTQAASPQNSDGPPVQQQPTSGSRNAQPPENNGTPAQPRGQ